MEQFIELIGVDALDGSLFVDHALTEQVHRDLHHGRTCTLAISRLEEPELAVLYGELHVLHIVIMVLEAGLDLIEFLVNLGHGFLHGRIFGHAIGLGNSRQFCPTLRADLGDLLRCTNAGYDVLALCIDQIFAVKKVLASCRVA